MRRSGEECKSAGHRTSGGCVRARIAAHRRSQEQQQAGSRVGGWGGGGQPFPSHWALFKCIYGTCSWLSTQLGEHGLGPSMSPSSEARVATSHILLTFKRGTPLQVEYTRVEASHSPTQKSLGDSSGWSRVTDIHPCSCLSFHREDK